MFLVAPMRTNKIFALRSGVLSLLGLAALLATAHPESSKTVVTSFTATPCSFTAGQPVTLSWSVENADSVSINQGVGTVAATGSAVVSPTASTTWTLTAARGKTSVATAAHAQFSRGEIDVYLLGGQSNMQGTALSSKLTPTQLRIPGIELYAAGSGVNAAIASKPVPLQPANLDKSGVRTFGLEIGLGECLRSLRPERPMAFLKYAWSGTSLEIDWKPGADNKDTANWGPHFRGFVTTVNNGLTALEAEGWVPVIRGMCWQQGEQDAKDGLNVPESDTSADDYGANLARFIGRVREQFSTRAGPDGIRFVAGQVLPYAPPGGDVATRFPGRNLVRQAILNADENSGALLSVSNMNAVPTNAVNHPSHAQEIDGYRDNEEVHQNAIGLLDIGRAMARALLKIPPQSSIDRSTDHGTGSTVEDLFRAERKLAAGPPHPLR